MKTAWSRGFVVLACSVAAGCAGWLSGTESNVPSSRLTAAEYTSPDSEYKVRIPPLIHPGARIDEAVGAAGQKQVGFIDDLGHLYVIQCARRASPDVTLDSMASTSTAGGRRRRHIGGRRRSHRPGRRPE